MSLKVRLLGSGSTGNAALVRAGRVTLLVDAGLPASRIEAGCGEEGVDPSGLDALLLSHDHSDHAGSAGLFSKRHRLPVLCLEGVDETLERAGRPLPRNAALTAGVDFGSLRVETFPVPHDAPNVGWRFRAGGMSIGLVTDLGQATSLVVESLRNCDVLMIEANYDPGRLRDGPYPWWLKQRISSSTGHLSNEEAGKLAVAAAGPATRRVVLVHLSETNNHPDIARRHVEAALGRAGRAEVRVDVASRSGLPRPVEI